MGSIVLIGRNSYLAENFISATRLGDRIRPLPHEAATDMSLKNVDCIVNFAYHPSYMTSSYHPEKDVDRVIVDRLSGTDIHYVMFSSRMVYGQGEGQSWAEDAPLNGRGHYGRNKVITERHVREKMGDACTILRLANLIEGKPKRHTFMGRALQTLKEEGRIVLDIDPSTTRDFLPLESFSRTLENVVEKRLAGTYNLGSGLATPVGQTALWVIDGYGQGELVATASKNEDSFVLDVKLLDALIGPICSSEDIKQSCVGIGRNLQNA